MFPAECSLCPCLKTDTVMMDQEEHIAEKSQQKFVTRSAARHLRRKRLHDARRAEKQENLINDLSAKTNQDSITQKDIDQPEVITKSKARRLRKKNKTKLLQNCCSYCKSYYKDISPVIQPAINQEVSSEKDTKDIRVITKSKARRLRKKNKTKLVQSTCSFCCDTYSSYIDPVLLKYINTKECNSSPCANLETDIINNLKQNYKPESIVEAQVCHIQYNRKSEQTEQKFENIESPENWSELIRLSKSPKLLSFGNEVQTYHENYDKSTEDLALTSQLGQKIVETIQTKINCTKEETRSKKSETKQFNELKNSPDLQKLTKSVNLVKSDQSIECSNIQHEKENTSKLESVSIKSKENTTSYLDRDFNKITELKSASGVEISFATFSSNEELLKNVKNLKFNDSLKIDVLKTSEGANTKVHLSNTDLQDKNIISVIKGDTKSVNSTKGQLETELVSSSSLALIQNYSFDLNSSQTEVKTTEKKIFPVSPVKNSDKLLNRISLSENFECDKQAIATTNMTDNKANVPEKSREEIKAEREAKKAAKALAKAKAKSVKVQDKDAANNKAVPPDNINSKEDSETLENVSDKNILASNKTSLASKTTNTYIKNTSTEGSIEGKSKAELRAERRAKQEAQRAAKQQLLQEKNKIKSKEGDSNKHETQITSKTDTEKKIVTPKKNVFKDNTHEINLFKHLYHEREQAIVYVPFVNSSVHPAIVRLGTQYANKVIVGSNARCVALLAAVKQLIQDFERPPQADFIRGLEASLQECVAYLHHCRPLAVSMQNALRHLKWQMTQLPSVLSDADAKSKLSNAIDTYILEQIQLADKAISITIQTKISNGDVILTYGYSSLINKILLDAHTAGKQFRVIVVDGRPWLEGKEQLRRLAKHGIECSYILINALSYIMPEVSKVFLGAHAILANGAVMSRVGTAQVALMARAFNIPVLVACETHKSCERVQTDSIVYNELGNADELVQVYRSGVKKSLLVNWKSRKSLNLLNITYDVTPADLVTAVVTELAILPCTSVPVILRIKPSEI